MPEGKPQAHVLRHHMSGVALPRKFTISPLMGRVLWVLFAIVFFQSGLTFTTWLLEPESFEGGFQWLWVVAFPFLVPAFFAVNRRLGCASGACRVNDGARNPGVGPQP